jgi:GTP:adenosylcobinamide-phosphate guanylyltransferase
MLAVVMCGGRGSRMAQSIEKSLLNVRNNSLIEYVLDALIGCGGFETIIAVPSVNTPTTSTFLYTHEYYTSGIIRILESKGENYSLDLSDVLGKIKPGVVFAVSADLPLLNPAVIQRIITRYLPSFPCTTIILETCFVKSFDILPSSILSIGSKEYCYSGIVIIDSSKHRSNSKLEEYFLIMNEKEIAINVNTVLELKIAERLLYP